jgi:hypothetical protein
MRMETMRMPRKIMNNEALGFGIGRFCCLESDRLTYSTDIWYYWYCTVTWAQAGACS